jgi:P-type Cu2+ transporter
VASDLNESMITGESRPVKKGEGDEVIAGTINGEGSLRVEVTGTGDETKLSGIMRLVADAQQSKSRAQHLADRAAQLLTGVAVVGRLVTLVVWQLAGAPIDFSIVRVVTVLVIACPHALGLAVPLVVAISTTMGARHGLLVRDRRGLEEARNLDVVIFDKTGHAHAGRVPGGGPGRGRRVGERRRCGSPPASSRSPSTPSPGHREDGGGARHRGPAADGFRAITGKGVAAVEGGVPHGRPGAAQG